MYMYRGYLASRIDYELKHWIYYVCVFLAAYLVLRSRIAGIEVVYSEFLI